MREYLMSLIIAALLVGLLGALVPEGEGGGLRRYVTFIGCLCVLILLISPVTHMLGFMSELSDGDIDISFDTQDGQYEQQFKQYITSLGEDSITAELTRVICEKFDISEQECHVKIDTYDANGEMAIGRVTVILSGKAIFRDPYEIEQYVNELLGCECTVVG
jgi:hypothetical protein